MHLSLRLLLILEICVVALCGPVRAEQLVVFSTYHNFPPFITGNGTGLTYDLANYLSDRSEKYEFAVEILPRKRLDVMLEKGDMIVPWVTPLWFGKGAKDRFHWIGPLINDGSLYVWNGMSKETYAKPSDLIGRQLGGISGYRYIGIDQLVEDGKITRTDVPTEIQLLQMIANHRVDLGIAPASGVWYILRNKSWEGLYQHSFHHTFERSLMIKSEDFELIDFLDQEISKIKNSGDWEYTLDSYGLAPLSKTNYM